MKKVLLVTTALVTLAGCGSNYRDLENVPLSQPDKVEIYANLDGHPNIARLCIDGRAFITTTRSGKGSWARAPYWDSWCGTELQ